MAVTSLTDAMKNSRTCQRCGASVPRSTPAQLCPGCLFDTALDAAEFSQAGQQSPAAPAASLDTGISASFGEYDLLGQIGRGGQGLVYRARHRVLGRVVALKAIPPAHLTR